MTMSGTSAWPAAAAAGTRHLQAAAAARPQAQLQCSNTSRRHVLHALPLCVVLECVCVPPALPC